MTDSDSLAVSRRKLAVGVVVVRAESAFKFQFSLTLSTFAHIFLVMCIVADVPHIPTSILILMAVVG